MIIAFPAILEYRGPRTYHIYTIDSTKLKTLILGVQYNVHHSAHFRRYNVIGGNKGHAFLQPLLEGSVGPLYARLHHVAGHQLQPLLEVLPEFLIGPVQPADK